MKNIKTRNAKQIQMNEIHNSRQNFYVPGWYTDQPLQLLYLPVGANLCSPELLLALAACGLS